MLSRYWNRSRRITPFRPSPSEWCSERTVQLTDEAVPKDWIVGLDSLEVLIPPLFPADSGGHVGTACLGHRWNGARASSPENAGGFITIIAGENIEPEILLYMLEVWEQPRMVQEAFNQ
jgi:hypothetical protein